MGNYKGEMQLKLIEERESNLLGRKELELEAKFDKSTPSNQEIKKEIASKLKIKEDLIAIKNIRQMFGIKKARIIVHVYNEENQFKKLEVKKEKKKTEEKKE